MVLSESAEAFYHEKGKGIFFNHQRASVSFSFVLFFTMSKEVFCSFFTVS